MNTRTFYQPPPELRPQTPPIVRESGGMRLVSEGWSASPPSRTLSDPLVEWLLLGLRQKHAGPLKAARRHAC